MKMQCLGKTSERNWHAAVRLALVVNDEFEEGDPQSVFVDLRNEPEGQYLMSMCGNADGTLITIMGLFRDKNGALFVIPEYTGPPFDRMN
jgi:hypothetical protein